MEPRYARLVGAAGTDIKKAITITREKAYPFKILEAKARNGKDIAFDVKAFSEENGEGYILTIENKKTVAGRYADTVILTTDSKIKPTINVPVYGQIISAAPQPGSPPQKKKSGEG
jgi:MinD superfamily P-loop ATPase